MAASALLKRDIELDEITRLDFPKRRRYSVNRLIIEADQDITRETIDECGGGVRAIAPHHLAANRGKLLRADARAHHTPHGSEREVNDPTNFPQPGKVFVVVD